MKQAIIDYGIVLFIKRVYAPALRKYYFKGLCVAEEDSVYAFK